MYPQIMKLSVIALLMCVYITTSLAEVKKKSKNDYSAQKKSLLNQLLKKEKRDFGRCPIWPISS